MEIPDPTDCGPETFGRMYDAYFARVYNYIRMRVRDAGTADDITSTVFERALDKLHSYDAQEGDFAPWLFGIARNAVNDHYRRLSLWKFTGLDLFENLAGRDPSPEKSAADGESREMLLAALAALDDRERDILAMKFSSGMKNREIASATGLGESNVAVIIFRALERLQTLLPREEARL
jgi:RNA polymerase sigma-70 factor (ECF subfamily)